MNHSQVLLNLLQERISWWRRRSIRLHTFYEPLRMKTRHDGTVAQSLQIEIIGRRFPAPDIVSDVLIAGPGRENGTAWPRTGQINR
jgi:hypothetical protein